MQYNLNVNLLCYSDPSHPSDVCVQVRSFATTFVVEFLERFTVENPQQLPVTIYDYYDPGKHAWLCNWLYSSHSFF